MPSGVRPVKDWFESQHTSGGKFSTSHCQKSGTLYPQASFRWFSCAFPSRA